LKKYILALDQGTSSSRAIIFTKNGEIHGIAQKEITPTYPKPGWVEHDPMEIWSSQLAVAIEVLAKTGVSASEIAVIGITNQRETTIVWNKITGKPIYNAIVWQCRRTADVCDEYIRNGIDEEVHKKTGLKIDAYFSATKVKWILDNVAGAKKLAEKGNLCFGTVDTWLLYNLTKGTEFATDYSNASRTMLFNIHTLKWDQDILNKLGIPESMLPIVKPSTYNYGSTHRNFFGEEIVIGSLIGDQQAALFGQCCFEPGMVKNTYGTGCFTLMHTGFKPIESKNGLLTTIAWGLNDEVEYAIEGSVFVAGAAVAWLRDGLKIIDDTAHSEYLATKVSSADGVYVVPAFVGLGAPYWDQHARGIIVGLTRGISGDHLVRATLESIAYQSLDIISAMVEDTGVPLKEIKADGGASNNNFLMQFQADIIAVDVLRPKMTETTALGAALLAGLTVGIYKNKEEIKQEMRLMRRFKARMNENERKNLIVGWHDAIKRSLSTLD